MNPEMSYWSNVADGVLPTELLISSEGQAVLKVGSNRDNKQICSVGVFRTQLEISRLAPLIAVLQSTQFAAIKNPESVLPGELIRKLVIKEKGQQEVMRFVSESVSPTPTFQLAEKTALEIAATVRQYPVHVITLKVTQAPERIDRGMPIKLALIIANYGSETIQVPHPLSWEEYEVALQWVALRSDIPEEEQEDFHQMFEDFTKENIQDIQVKSANTTFVTLSPKEELCLILQKEIDWPPGQYNTELSCQMPVFDWKGKELIRCEVIGKPFKIKCIGESKPDDEPSDEDVEKEFEEDESLEDEFSEGELSESDFL